MKYWIIKFWNEAIKIKFKLKYSNSSEFKAKFEDGNNSAAEFDTKFINIAELLMKSYKNLLVESDLLRVRQYW